MHIVIARNLSKYYGHLKAVDGIDFEISRGECFGFLGPNGAGKTTVMRMVYCFVPPSSGELKVFGIDISEKPSFIKSRIGVMPQEDNLDPDLSVLENLIVYARYFDIPKKESLNLLGNFLNSLN
ncbi:MAG: ABC transporter ATP-binding protein [Nitrospirae bacterium]|nr:ABC transporter ATP-binding protein [Nitrospirota bacterium]